MNAMIIVKGTKSPRNAVNPLQFSSTSQSDELEISTEELTSIIANKETIKSDGAITPKTKAI